MRTLFNLLGSLTNPAGARRLLIGVFAAAWVEPVAALAGRLGAEHVLDVYAEDGMDEISISVPTRIAEHRAGRVHVDMLTPERHHIARGDVNAARVRDAVAGKAVIDLGSDGVHGPARDVACLNAGAALSVSGLSPRIDAGIARAARAKVRDLADLTQQ